MKTKEELFDVFGKGLQVVQHEEKAVQPVVVGKNPDVMADDGVTVLTVGADIVEEQEVTTFREEVIDPYFFYASETPPADFIQWVSDNIPVEHKATVVEGVLYVATASEIAVSGLVSIV